MVAFQEAHWPSCALLPSTGTRASQFALSGAGQTCADFAAEAAVGRPQPPQSSLASKHSPRHQQTDSSASTADRESQFLATQRSRRHAAEAGAVGGCLRKGPLQREQRRLEWTWRRPRPCRAPGSYCRSPASSWGASAIGQRAGRERREAGKTGPHGAAHCQSLECSRRNQLAHCCRMAKRQDYDYLVKLLLIGDSGERHAGLPPSRGLPCRLGCPPKPLPFAATACRRGQELPAAALC